LATRYLILVATRFVPSVSASTPVTWPAAFFVNVKR
jgi:hypothetical protein